MARRLALLSQRGFTIVELLVATTVLAVGILGTVSIIDTSNANTSKTKAREGATNLGRAVMEIARAVPYKDLTAPAVLNELENHAGLGDYDLSTPGHQIRSRNFTYTVSVDVCSLDDAKDRLGTHDEAVTFCSDSDVAPTGTTTLDRNPDDYRRVSIAMSYRSPDVVTATAKQTGLITNPVGGLGPSITSLRITAPTADDTSIETEAATASFSALTSVSAKEVQWSIDGSPKGTATGSGTSWSFNWDLTETLPGGQLRYRDCTYVIRAEAFDDKDRSGAPKALTINLNRIRPVAPTGFAGGRNLNGNLVDLEWSANRECDIEAYRVYRGTSPTAPLTDKVCETAANVTECIDDAPAPQAGTTLYYEVVGVDVNPSGAREEGTRSSRIAISEGNNPPQVPPNLQACVGGNPGCNDIDGNAAPGGTIALSWDASTDPDAGDEIAFYRVYRGGNTYDKRLDVLFPVAGKPLVFVDDEPVAGPNTYYVSAVDSRYGESALIGSVTITP